MRKYARFGRKLRKLTRQAKICTPPGGEVIAKICVLRSKDLYSRIETGRALPRVRQHEVRQSHIGCRAFEQPFGLRPLSLIAGFLLVLAGRMSGQLACYGTGACWARLRKFALPTPRYGQLAKICTGNLTGSGLRKYALRQNHTIPV